jgi:alkylated DNA repair protein (DNA oxidative demethylase)
MNAAESTIVLTLDMPTQRRLFAQVCEVKRASPFVRPVSVTGQPMSVRITSAGRLGWVADGQYRYTDRDANGNPWPEMLSEWREIADLAIGSLCSVTPYEGPVNWDSAIINWYEPGASLGWHRDRSERDRTKPIVTISLGYAARWAVEVETRGVDEHGRPVVGYERSRCRLPSGAVTVLAGDMRGCPHAIEGLVSPDDDLQGSLFGAPEPSPIVDAKGVVVPGRISITVRQAG